MHSRVLRYFDEVVRRGSIRKAAEHLHVAPTAINRQILDLEAELGAPLFDRISNRLRLTPLGAPSQILTRGGPGFGDPGFGVAARIPAGHPEGYLEAFASLYSDAADAIETGQMPDHLPGLADGLHGMRFIAACIASSRADGVWTRL